MSESTALLDNSSFAGVMRLLVPDLEAHRTFLDRYPEHRAVDEVSLADFLTAICAFDNILLENSSRTAAFAAADVQQLPVEDPRNDTWVAQLLRLLPAEIRRLVYGAPLDEKEGVILAEAATEELAFDIFRSPLAAKVRLQGGEKLPQVYTSPTYVYRERFVALNEAAGRPLDAPSLAQAMFLHRGLYLQRFAQKNSATYLPYLYRGRMLASLPPVVALDAGDLRLPLLQDRRTAEAAPLRELSEHYYALLNKVTWAAYDEQVPFIGAAILASARGSVQGAFDLALDLRARGEVLATFRELRQALDGQDRVLYDVALASVKDTLTKACQSLGASIADPRLKTFYNLATFWAPHGLKEAIAAFLELLPLKVKARAERWANALMRPNSYQLLFLRHVEAIRG